MQKDVQKTTRIQEKGVKGSHAQSLGNFLELGPPGQAVRGYICIVSATLSQYFVTVVTVALTMLGRWDGAFHTPLQSLLAHRPSPSPQDPMPPHHPHPGAPLPLGLCSCQFRPQCLLLSEAQPHPRPHTSFRESELKTGMLTLVKPLP